MMNIKTVWQKLVLSLSFNYFSNIFLAKYRDIFLNKELILIMLSTVMCVAHKPTLKLQPQCKTKRKKGKVGSVSSFIISFKTFLMSIGQQLNQANANKSHDKVE